MKNQEASPPVLLVSLALLLAGAACGTREPATEAERLAYGRAIIARMSEQLGAAKAFSVTTEETRVEIDAKGQPQTVRLSRETVVRRPDRLYSRIISDRPREIWYDGVGLTVVMHGEKVFAQARMPETLDKTLDAMHERYGVATPLADFVYSSPSKALVSSTAMGGWEGREGDGADAADHLSFKDSGVRWDLWVASTGDPMPRRVVMEFLDDQRLRKVEVTFKDWNLAPPIAADRFSPTVPADYEGIAMVQRARVLRHIKGE
jgi:hypothetical protein